MKAWEAAMTAHERSVCTMARHIRSRICSICAWRTAGTRHIPLDDPLPCEVGCSIFRHLGLLAKYAEQLDPTVSSYDHVVSALGVDCCGRGIKPHDIRAAGCSVGDCPLKRYRKELASVMRNIGHSMPA
jgi:hypothetical protein